jgi:cysteine desulfurase
VAAEKALALALEAQAERTAYVQRLHDRLVEALSAYPQVYINSPHGAVPHILNVSVEPVKAAAFHQALSSRGVCVSIKSACSTDGTPSKAVFAVSRSRKRALSSWRISLSHLTTEQELEEFLNIFDQCYKELIP